MEFQGQAEAVLVYREVGCWLMKQLRVGGCRRSSLEHPPLDLTMLALKGDRMTYSEVT